MATTFTFQNKRSPITILNLPEAIFREIFKRLDLETIYSMKDVCQQIKHYVDGFLELGGIFMLATGRDVPNEFIHIFKQTNKKPIIYSTLGDPYPYPRGFRATDLWSFGATLNKKTVLGVYHGHVENFKFNLHEYDHLKNKWHLIKPSRLKDAGYSSKGYSTELERKLYSKAAPIISCCSIGMSELVLFYGGYSNTNNSAQLLRVFNNNQGNI